MAAVRSGHHHQILLVRLITEFRLVQAGLIIAYLVISTSSWVSTIAGDSLQMYLLIFNLFSLITMVDMSYSSEYCFVFFVEVTYFDFTRNDHLSALQNFCICGVRTVCLISIYFCKLQISIV